MSRAYYVPSQSTSKKEEEQGPFQGIIIPDEFKPTEPEKIYLESCIKRRIVLNALPLSIFCGMIGFYGAIHGYFLHPRYGSGPATIGVSFLTLGLLGYYVQEWCIADVVKEFPNGTARLVRPDLIPKLVINLILDVLTFQFHYDSIIQNHHVLIGNN
ncbi:hypothetical protein QAD02_009617 [Eretmocerus hayati]|uniref:Uncharacterized protein n=1 Tax=Eretmocerus hayati TaxID=131215 RepID=A0ACC2NCA4_9HYME|nr:hypothetical protein QAD02_009617 [Eretmocerus hayati]